MVAEPPIHGVPVDVKSTRPHRESSSCWCGPVVALQDIHTGRYIIRHRPPPLLPPQRRPRDA